jgi:uncharacterized protein (UPF0335 family)
MTVLTGTAQKQLKGFVERVERLNEEKQSLADDIKSVIEELKASGFHVKTFRKVIALRKQDASKRQEEESLLDLYLHALGMTPLETAIAEAEEAAGKVGDGVSTVDPIARAAKKGGGKGGRRKKGEAPSLSLVGGGEGQAKGESSGGEGEANGKGKPHSPAAEAAAAMEGREPPPPAVAAGLEGRPAPMF